MDGWRFDHVGVVVRSLERGRSNLVVVGVSEWTEPLRDPINGVLLQFGRDRSGLVYELLEPIDEESPVYGALAGRKNILNHVAYRVQDLEAASREMRAARCAPTSEPRPAIAFGGNLIQFFVTPLNMVVELIEAFDFHHSFGHDVAHSQRD